MKAHKIAALIAAAPLALAANSAPQPLPLPAPVPMSRDIPYPGTMTIRVDATDIERGILDVKQTIPVEGGPVILLFPQWMPGGHSPRGALKDIAGLEFRSGGKKLNWTRDPVEVFAMHVDVPEGAKSVDVTLKLLTPTATDQGRISITREMMNIQPEASSLYPAGYFTRQIPVTYIVTYPKGWQAATALRPAATNGDTVTYGTVPYETLVDSPIFAGKYFRKDDLGYGVTLNTVADDPKELVVPADVLQKHRNLATQAVKLFGARHFDHYDFLHAVTDRMGGIGLEHHRSSENQNDPDYFTDWQGSLPDHNLLPHEFTHSWNGKFRRPADLWTPDYRYPMRGSGLWVYEGQTQFWGYMLEARSGLSTKQEVLDKLALVAASLETRAGREWRPLIDTTNDPIIAQRRPKGWVSYERSEDYYNEGMMIWIEADAIIREGTKGARGMDDFAKAFFGINDGDWGEVVYTRDDLINTLNSVYPYDWRTFFVKKVDTAPAGTVLNGFTKSGYTLTYTDTPTPAAMAAAKAAKSMDFTYSLGLATNKDAKITSVAWDGPAFDAGLTLDQTIVAIDGRVWSEDAAKAAITAAKGRTAPITLTVKRGDSVRDVAVKWNGGLRYPRFVKTGKGDGPLDKLLAPRP
jgi:predicted metalloprotease with PDZ domain